MGRVRLDASIMGLKAKLVGVSLGCPHNEITRPELTDIGFS